MAIKVFATGADPLMATPERVTSYNYDTFSRLATVVEDLDPASMSDTPLSAAYRYDLLGSLDRTDMPNGVVVDYVYDGLQRLDKHTHYSPDSTPNDLSNNAKLAEFDSAVRDDGKRTAATETFWLDSDNNGVPEPHVNEIAWWYDDVGRLTDEVFNHFDDNFDQTEHFVYDLVGNRLEKTKDAGNNSSVDESIAYSYDDNDRLLAESLDQGDNGSVEQTTTYGWTVTQQGSKTVKDASQATLSSVTYSYDLQGRLAQATTSTYTAGAIASRQRVSYDYDATGIRVSSLVETDTTADGTYESAVRTDFLFDHDNFTGYQQAIKETFIDQSTGNVQKVIEYTYGHDEIAQTVTQYNALGAVTSATTHTFGHDGHGSVRILFDAAALTQLYTFDAYGQLLGIHLHDASLASAAASESLASLLYSGERFDANTQQQYLRARFYEAATGRFRGLDSYEGDLSIPLSLHKYAYGHLDPVNGVDPTGNFLGLVAVPAASIGRTNHDRTAVATGASMLRQIASIELVMNFRLRMLAGLVGVGTGLTLTATSLETKTLEDLRYNEDPELSQDIQADELLDRAVAIRVGLIQSTDSTRQKIPVFIERLTVLFDVAMVDSQAMIQEGHPSLLHYEGPMMPGNTDLSNRLRNALVRGPAQKYLRADVRASGNTIPAGWWIEEYPFASSLEGGFGAWVDLVREENNSEQGRQFAAFIRRHRITTGDAFLVVVIP